MKWWQARVVIRDHDEVHVGKFGLKIGRHRVGESQQRAGRTALFLFDRDTIRTLASNRITLVIRIPDRGILLMETQDFRL